MFLMNVVPFQKDLDAQIKDNITVCIQPSRRDFNNMTGSNVLQHRKNLGFICSYQSCEREEEGLCLCSVWLDSGSKEIH